MLSNKAVKLKYYLLIISLPLFCYSVYAVDNTFDEYSMISTQRRAELHNLLIQDCGSCHGMTMKGGLGPALTLDALASKSRKMIEITISHGRPGTPMPPWSNILSKEEIGWLVDRLYSGVSP